MGDCSMLDRHYLLIIANYYLFSRQQIFKPNEMLRNSSIIAVGPKTGTFLSLKIIAIIRPINRPFAISIDERGRSLVSPFFAKCHSNTN